MRLIDRIALLGTLAVICSGAGCRVSVEQEAAAAQAHAQELALRQQADAAADHMLIAWAALPQSERRPGPTSGHFIAPANGVVPPFESAQPIPGWSGLLQAEKGTFTAMPDNGFGAKGNSADYVLRVLQRDRRVQDRGG
jgi:hypothetical protein